MSLENHLKTQFNLEFSDFYSVKGLEKLDEKFAEFIVASRHCEPCETRRDNPDLQIDLLEKAKLLEDFLALLFDVKNENDALKKQHDDLQKIYFARREFVQRHVAKKYFNAPQSFDYQAFLTNKNINFSEIDELEKFIAAEILAQKNLEDWEIYTSWALYSVEGVRFHKNGALFFLPAKTDPQNLIKKCAETKNRNSFNLTDEGAALSKALGQAHYCIFCHKQNKDSCKTGLIDKETAEIKIDSLGVELHGCPLDEKISEMNLLKSQGFSLAALAIACIDNPMIAGTGHRICNDCMKSCIYQKQEPVDIPQIETRTLKDVLALPYGFEIYSLLTRWNPLAEKKLLQKNSGKKVLVCGLGPAGYTLAHYLLNDGHEVVAIDGLKIEPLNAEISGIDLQGNRQAFKPIKFIDEIYEPLSSRTIGGFGGVAEYGITVRWNKNFLKIIRLLLERRENFRMFGGIRFGSSITDEIAFEQYGFDHVALCLGAGRPNIINIKNNFAKGIRSASDFLMSLQLTGAFKENLFTNLQIRMPAIVIGGGLTAVDTGCEVKTYYQIQIKKFAKKISIIGKENFFKKLSLEEKNIAQEFLSHAEKLARGEDDFLDVKILYRKKMQHAPAYRLNHEELQKALEEGVEFIEDVNPLAAQIDEFGAIENLETSSGIFPCRALLVAAGTTPNLSPKLEDNLDFETDGKYFAEISENHKHYAITHSARPKQFSVITKIDDATKKAVSFFGDLHPNFEGNVVKAMASAKLGHVQISEILQHQAPIKNEIARDYKKDFLVTIEKIERLSSHVVEVFIKAPLIANQSKIGQIFRLQNYHVLAKKIDGEILAMEGVPLTALNVDYENGIISAIALEVGASTKLIENFQVGEPCIFMGPSGKPTEIGKNEVVVLIGGGRGNQPLTALAQAFKNNGCKVIFFAGYRKNSYIVRRQKMQEFSDELIVSIEDDLRGSDPLRGQTPSLDFHGSVIDSIKNYFSKNKLKIDRILTVGNNHLMHEVARLRHENIIEDFANAKISITSLNAPMQCMMKGVCSQCLQKKMNEKGEMEYFYSCANQDVDSDKLDFAHLHNRCAQNALAERIANEL